MATIEDAIGDPLGRIGYPFGTLEMPWDAEAAGKLAADREAAEKLAVHRGCSANCILRNGILCTRGDHAGGCAPIRDAVASSRDAVATT